MDGSIETYLLVGFAVSVIATVGGVVVVGIVLVKLSPHGVARTLIGGRFDATAMHNGPWHARGVGLSSRRAHETDAGHKKRDELFPFGRHSLMVAVDRSRANSRPHGSTPELTLRWVACAEVADDAELD